MSPAGHPADLVRNDNKKRRRLRRIGLSSGTPERTTTARHHPAPGIFDYEDILLLCDREGGGGVGGGG